MHNCFKENQNLQEAFITSDGTAFYTDNAAKNHAATLENKLVKREVRETEEVDPREALEEMNVPELKAMAEGLEIDFDKKVKKAELVDLILAKQAEGPASDPEPYAPKMIKLIVTEEDLDNNPSLAEEGVKVCDEIEVAVEEEK